MLSSMESLDQGVENRAYTFGDLRVLRLTKSSTYSVCTFPVLRGSSISNLIQMCKPLKGVVYFLHLFFTLFAMSEELRKRPVSRRRNVAAPLHEGGAPVSSERSASSVCGHSSCSETCNVRYVGAVSQISDHHALHAARGVGHIWTATIVTGFAIVVTGAIALQSAQARVSQPPAAGRDMAAVMQRLDRIERAIMETQRACMDEGSGGEHEGEVSDGGDERTLQGEIRERLREGILPRADGSGALPRENRNLPPSSEPSVSEPLAPASRPPAFRE